MSTAIGHRRSNEVVHLVAQKLFFVAYLMAPFLTRSGLILVLVTPLLISRLPRPRELIFLVLLMLGLCGYYILGGEQIRPDPLTMSQGMIRLFSTMPFILPLFFVDVRDAEGAIQYLMIGCLAFVFYEGVWTLLNSPETVLERFMVYPKTKQEVNSTGQINAAALGAGFLLVISRKVIVGWLALACVLFLSIAYQNRTGMVLFATYVVTWLLLRRGGARWLRWLMPIGMIGMISLSYLASQGGILQAFAPAYTRLTTEGIESVRYRIQARGLSHFLSGDFPFGGAQLNGLGETSWYHNLFLDSYRVGGYFVMALFGGIVLLSLSSMVRARDFGFFVIWTMAFLVSQTSISVEGLPMEFYSVFSIFAFAMMSWQKAVAGAAAAPTAAAPSLRLSSSPGS
jgi:hypothetical protein